jgi:catechol 2,3-dioxygenase-like lactoylglutathione lyase family enzyme
MARALGASIDHIGLNIPEASFTFWQELLAYLGFTIKLDGNHFDAEAAAGAFVCVSATKQPYAEAEYHRRHTGLSHLALRVASVAEVDAFVTEFLAPRGIKPLYGGARAYDYTPGYYAVYAEDPSRLKIEVMTDDADLSAR